MKIASSILVACSVLLFSCTGHWDTLRYYSGRQGEPVVDADFRLDIGHNYVKMFKTLDERRSKMRDLLLEQVSLHKDCEGGDVGHFRYGCLEGCGVLYISGSCRKKD